MPNIIITGNDTASLVSAKTGRDIRDIKQDLKACNILADDLHSQIQRYILLASDNEKYLDNSDKQIMNLNQQIVERNVVMQISDKQLKRANRNVKLLKFGFITVSAIAVIELGYIGLRSVIP